MTERVDTLKTFFQEARAGRLTAIRCTRCGALALPPKEFCVTCQERRWEPISLTGAGTVTSYTVIRIPPRGRAAEAPYAVAVVKLDEGVSALGRLVDIPIETLRSGLRVQFRPIVTEQQTAIGFGPA